MKNPLIAYCGLDCEKCDARLATVHDDNALREKTATLWSELNQVPIAPEMISCMGCRTEGVKTVFCEQLCQIRRCAAEKGLEACADCPQSAACADLAKITLP